MKLLKILSISNLTVKAYIRIFGMTSGKYLGYRDNKENDKQADVVLVESVDKAAKIMFYSKDGDRIPKKDNDDASRGELILNGKNNPKKLVVDVDDANNFYFLEAPKEGFANLWKIEMIKNEENIKKYKFVLSYNTNKCFKNTREGFVVDDCGDEETDINYLCLETETEKKGKCLEEYNKNIHNKTSKFKKNKNKLPKYENEKNITNLNNGSKPSNYNSLDNNLHGTKIIFDIPKYANYPKITTIEY